MFQAVLKKTNQQSIINQREKMKIKMSFKPGSRYEYDFKICTSKKGWAQIDTENDASYFGNWINPRELKVLSYMEGDLIEKTAENKKELIEIIEEMKDYCEKINIDPGFNEELKNDLIDLGLEKYLH